MAKSEFFLAFNEITETHHLPREVVIEALRQALISAYRRDSGIGTAQSIEAEVDPQTSRYRIMVEKEVIDTDIVNSRTEITIEEAHKLDPHVHVGDMIMAPEDTNTKSFGRIAAQTAKQVILQKIREAERKSLYDEYKDREGDLVSGQIQSINGQNITLSLGRAEAIMPHNQQIKGERYHPRDKIRTFVLEVKETNRGPQIVVSRAHKNMLRRLLEYEVPEIYNGQVEIQNIAREAGHRSKVAVSATQPGIDPVGACVGMRGMRIQSIVKELNEEKIDVIEWNADPSIFIAKSLSPARVSGVYLEDDIDQGHTATVIVPDDQLSLAIGREGQNARLAAKLTGWRIDIKSVSEAANNAYVRINEPPLAKLAQDQEELTAEVGRILEKKRADRAVTPEEYHMLARFVQLAEQRLLDQRELLREKRRKAIDRVRPSVPDFAFTMQIEELELAKDITQAVKHLGNVGELMVRVLADSDSLRVMLDTAKAGSDAMDAIQEAIDSLVLARQEQELRQPTIVPPQPVAEPIAALPQPTIVEEQAKAEVVDDEEAPPAFIDEVTKEKEPEKPRVVKRIPKPVPQPEPVAVATPAVDSNTEDEDEDSSDGKKREKEKKGKNRSRELVFDEKRGEVVAKRKRKGNRGRGWDYEG